jgi:hypothetical protein
LKQELALSKLLSLNRSHSGEGLQLEHMYLSFIYKDYKYRWDKISWNKFLHMSWKLSWTWAMQKYINVFSTRKPLQNIHNKHLLWFDMIVDISGVWTLYGLFFKRRKSDYISNFPIHKISMSFMSIYTWSIYDISHVGYTS